MRLVPAPRARRGRPARRRPQLAGCSGRLRVAVVAAAAALVIGVLGGQVVRQDHRIATLQSALEGQGPLRAANLALADPHAQKVQLTSADGSVTASAVVLPDGTGYLMSGDMPSLGKGRTYQLWGQTGGGLISLGLLGSRAQRCGRLPGHAGRGRAGHHRRAGARRHPVEEPAGAGRSLRLTRAAPRPSRRWRTAARSSTCSSVLPRVSPRSGGSAGRWEWTPMRQSRRFCVAPSRADHRVRRGRVQQRARRTRPPRRRHRRPRRSPHRRTSRSAPAPTMRRTRTWPSWPSCRPPSSVEVGTPVNWQWTGTEPHSVTFLTPGQTLPERLRGESRPSSPRRRRPRGPTTAPRS